MDCLTVKELIYFLSDFKDDAPVMIVGVNNHPKYGRHLDVSDCCDAAMAIDDYAGVYLYTSEACEVCDEES